jgi:hypothetical protein
MNLACVSDAKPLRSEETAETLAETDPQTLGAGREVVSSQVGGRDAKPARTPQL